MADAGTKEFDIVVIGGGPGGYPAAIRAAQAGKRVALVEAKELGGTCLNRGCIPSKTLIASADMLKKAEEAEEFGVLIGNLSFDYGRMVERKDRIVEGIRKNLEGLIASNNITLIRGFAKFLSTNELKVTGQDNVVIRAANIIIATGSEPRNLPSLPVDGKHIHNSTTLLELKALPQSIIIVGGGIIGCEFASLFSALGVQVTILELLPRILPMEPQGVSTALAKAFEKKGIAMHTNVAVKSAEVNDGKVHVKLNDGPSFESDILLVSVGRKLNTDAIGLDRTGVQVQENGLINVNSRMETTVPGIYAIGDIASKWWLAHVATHQGLVAASNAVGIAAEMEYRSIPSVIYTTPEIATVGLSLEEAIKEGYQATLGAFPYQALGKALAVNEPEGFAQIVIDKTTHQILGAQVVGYQASTLIAQMGVAITNELTVESITETIHAHPTLAEMWLEAALIAHETPLHLPPPRRKPATAKA